MYVKPNNNAIWNKEAIKIHGLHKNHPKIINAKNIEYVWKEFKKFY